MIVQATTSLRQDWCETLPKLTGGIVGLRELERRDAASLHEQLCTPEVTKFISPPPDTVDGFERFISWTQEQRGQGRFACYGIVPHGMETAVGLVHIRRLDQEFRTGELGFALGSAFWGTGLFAECAELLVDFAFDVVEVTRLEARVALPNGRGHSAMRKLGAVQEAVLRRSFVARGQCLDQALWSIVDTDRQDWKRLQRVYIH